jgi:capsular polysaccharide transport system permease protein
MARLLRSRSRNGWADRSTVPATVPAAGPALPASPSAAGFPVSAEDRGKVAVFPGSSYPREVAADQHGRRFPLGLVSFILVVIIPTVLAGVYYLIIAADQYVAEFRFALRTAEPVRSEANSILGSQLPSPIGVDSYAVVQYIGSRDIVDDVGKTLDLQAMFSRLEADWLARLELPVTIEELVRYWKNQVDGFFDASNGTIVVRVRAFAPDDALSLAQAVLASSERLVNELSARARRDTLHNSKREVQRAERRLKTALARLREFRDREGIIDPRKTADATQALAGRIRDEIVRAETELATVRHYMRPDAPSVKMLEARIQSLQTQLRSVESEVTDTERSRSEVLSRVMGSYEQLESERGFAEKAYQHALEALDRSRMNADRQQVYIAGFVQPSLPEEALYPRRLRAVGIALFLCCAIWLIGAFAVQTVREHL